MWLLEDKPFDTAQFKLYVAEDKLVEVLEKQPADTMGTGCSCLQTQAPEPTVDTDEPNVQPKHKFKLGDHVVVGKGTEDERTGVIVRLPMDGVECHTSYVVDLDDKNLGWDATVAVDGVDCKNAWVAGANKMELLANQNSRLIDQRNKLLDMVERLQSTKSIPKIEMMQTPAGYVKVGDVIGYDRSNKRIRFGTITRLTKDGYIYLKNSYSVVYGDDGKQAIYQSMDGSIEQYRVCKVL